MSDLFDVTAAQAAKDEGMERVAAAANAQWRRDMLECLLSVARRQHQFTADDIFAEAAARDIKSETHDRRALGPIVASAAKEGICHKANCAPVLSSRRSRHAAPLTVWESNLVR